jgi:O-acetyl-ADP-ribose deacetylase (regulator of RNase III)
MEKKVGTVTIQVVSGDIAAQADVEAVVNAANAQLLPGGGVAGAIHRAAGPGLNHECRPLAPIQPGEAVITGGHSLPNRYVVHCLGPVYGRDNPSDVLLGNCYRNALNLADSKEIASIAFPSLSTGIFGYPVADAARIAFKAVTDRAHSLKHVRRIRFVLFGDEARMIHEKALEEVLD